MYELQINQVSLDQATLPPLQATGGEIITPVLCYGQPPSLSPFPAETQVSQVGIPQFKALYSKPTPSPIKTSCKPFNQAIPVLLWAERVQHRKRPMYIYYLEQGQTSLEAHFLKTTQDHAPTSLLPKSKFETP